MRAHAMNRPLMPDMWMLFRTAPLAAALTLALAGPAAAQFGGIFGGPAPRPPAGLPGDQSFPGDTEEEDVPDLPQGGRVLPAPGRLPPPGGAQPPAGPIQTQPLPPPTAAPGQASPRSPGMPAPTPPVATAPSQLGNTAAAPAGANGTSPLPGLPPGQRQPRGTPSASLQPGDEIVVEPPAVKIVNKGAMFAGLDKITGRVIKFDATLGETVQFGALRITPRACYTRPPTEASNTDAFVEVDEITLKGEVKRIFSGWMYASSPGLHGVDHPIYDIWLNDCKEPQTQTVAAPAAVEPPKPPPAPARPAQQPRRQQSAPRPAPDVMAPPPGPGRFPQF